MPRIEPLPEYQTDPSLITSTMGPGRWLHTMSMLGDDEPVVHWNDTPARGHASAAAAT